MSEPIGKRISEPGGRSGAITAVSDDGIWWTVAWDDGTTDEVHIACVIPADRVHVLPRQP